MELRVLTYFVTVAEEGNISTAAALLHVGQPTLSRQLKELERELGQKLFVRQSHGIKLTEAGELLRDYAIQMVDLSRKVRHDFAIMLDTPMGDVNLGGIGGCHNRWLAQIMREAREEYPSIIFHYSVENVASAITKLDRGAVDFVVVGQPIHDERYESLALPHEEEWVAYMREDNPLATKASLTPSDLAHQPLVMFEQVMNGADDSTNLPAWFGEHYAHLTVAATSNVTYVNCAFAEEGLGTFIVREEIARSIGDASGMVIRPLNPPLRSRMTLVWYKGRVLRPAAAQLLALIKEHMDIA